MEIKIALAGNPNCGKTTLFNSLTGSNQYVGNWPGVTVEKKEGKLKKNKDVTVVDLPGIYSLSPYTLEEVVARNFLVTERPDAILNIVDGTISKYDDLHLLPFDGTVDWAAAQTQLKHFEGPLTFELSVKHYDMPPADFFRLAYDRACKVR